MFLEVFEKLVGVSEWIEFAMRRFVGERTGIERELASGANLNIEMVLAYGYR